MNDDKVMDDPARIIEVAVSLLHEAYALMVLSQLSSAQEIYAVSCLEDSINSAEEAVDLLEGDHE